MRGNNSFGDAEPPAPSSSAAAQGLGTTAAATATAAAGVADGGGCADTTGSSAGTGAGGGGGPAPKRHSVLADIGGVLSGLGRSSSGGRTLSKQHSMLGSGMHHLHSAVLRATGNAPDVWDGECEGEAWAAGDVGASAALDKTAYAKVDELDRVSPSSQPTSYWYIFVNSAIAAIVAAGSAAEHFLGGNTVF